MILQMQGGVLDINDEVSMHVDDTNPIYNEVGSQSLPVTLPATPHNRALLGWPERMDSAVNVNSPERRVAVHAGSYHRMGVINVTEAGPEGITLNVGFDNSEAYAKWQNKSLKDLDGLPVLEFGSVAALLERMDYLFAHADSQVDEMAVVPVLIEQTDKYDRYLNHPDPNDPTRLERVTSYPTMNGDARVDVAVPEGYGITPSLRVWRVINLVFADLGLRVVSNPFLVSRDLSRLVMLNNVADACCTGTIGFYELMPDVTVETFLQSLYTRFGLVYNIDFTEGTVELMLLRDIIAARPWLDITEMLVDRPKVCYDVPKYVRLSASTSLEGAAPAAADWDTFSKGKRLDRCSINKETWATWFSVGDSIASSGFFAWDPHPEGMEAIDVKSEDECVPVSIVYPYDGIEHRPGDQSRPREIWPLYFVEPDHYNTVMGEGQSGTSSNTIIGGGVQRGRNNGTGTAQTTSSNTPTGAGSSQTHATAVQDKYRYGSGSEVAGKTPLCYLMAYTRTDLSVGTVGRLGPWRSNGNKLRMLDGAEAEPEVSLVFDFEGGHFDLFWRGFDELCRHSARWVEAKAMMHHHELAGFNVVGVVKCDDVLCLPDKISYDLTDALRVEATMRLRVMQTQGDYDIDEEQRVAPR